jgi:thiamine biosynthesis protein ThiI
MESVIVHYQEVALKGRNRPWFIGQLVRNLREITVDLDVVDVRALMGRIEIRLGPLAEWQRVRERIGRVFGIANFSQARRAPCGIDELSAAIVKELEGRTPKSFRVTARRADKTYPLTSPELEREVGGRVKAAYGWKVDLSHPELIIRIELLPVDAFFSFDKHQGPGGLPSGTSGRAMCLLSGGIDSPVAAYRIMKRGCRVRFVHFHSYPLLSHASQEKVQEVVNVLTKYQLSSRLYVVAFGEMQRQIVLTAPPALRVVLYRRLMMRIAERLARKSGAGALVTGESLGQVASQTLENLGVINAVVSLPVLRPLVGSDKEEITAEALSLGTYEISIIPDQDCCQLFTPRNPATKAKLEKVEQAEAKLPLEEMIETAVDAAEREDFYFPKGRRRHFSANKPGPLII